MRTLIINEAQPGTGVFRAPWREPVQPAEDYSGAGYANAGGGNAAVVPLQGATLVANAEPLVTPPLWPATASGAPAQRQAVSVGDPGTPPRSLTAMLANAELRGAEPLVTPPLFG